MSLRWIVMASCLMAAASSAKAETAAVVVDKVFQSGSFLHVLMRVTNTTAREADRLEIICDVFDRDGAALGRAEDVVHSVPANETAVGEALAEAPPGGSEPTIAKCRVAR